MHPYIWEDPFREEQAGETPLWLPRREEAPVRLEPIRRRQEKLLPYIDDLRRAATEIMRRVGRQPGGVLYIAAVREPFMIDVLMRDAVHPAVMRTFGPIALTGHAVRLPASAKPDIPLFDHLLPTQKISDVAGRDDRKAVLHAETQLGLVRRMAVSEEGAPPEKSIVVYPELLKFIGHWIAHIETPLTELDIVHEKDGSNILARRATPFAEGPRLH